MQHDTPFFDGSVNGPIAAYFAILEISFKISFSHKIFFFRFLFQNPVC